MSVLSFQVFRGIQSVDPEQWESWTGEKSGFKVQKNRLGSHWSTDPKVAKGFAQEPGSVVLHGSVSSDAVVRDRNEQINLGADDTLGEYANEKEVPVRPGSRVKIHRIDTIKDSRTRTRKYKPPREMTT
jgi:hypothetical protein